MARHTPVPFLVALCLTTGVASAQVVMGAARAPGVTYHPPPPKPETPAQAAEPRSHARLDRLGDHRPAPGEDLFRARPDAYTPAPYRTPSLRHASIYSVYATPGVVVQPVIVERIVERVVVVEEERRQGVPADKEERRRGVPADKEERRRGVPADRVPQIQREPQTKTESAPPPPVLVAMPKTFYVIPRCYAGDTPPVASRLPAGCDVRNTKVIAAGAL